MTNALTLKRKLQAKYNRHILQDDGSKPPIPTVTQLGQSLFGTSWLGGKHISLIEQKLHEVIEGKTKRLILELPPRYAKTTLACQLLVPVYLAHHPHHRAIYTSYQAGKAAEWGRKCRDVVETYKHQLGISVRQDSRASHFWNIDGYRGGMLTAGVGGPLIGSGAHLLIIDDPIKNHEEADSPLQREKLWDWLQSTALTRLEPGAAVIVIMHRWRRDDIVGRLRQESDKTGEKWDVVTLPALAGASDVLGRAPGECLWPERFPQTEVEERKKSTAPRWWYALYDQNPQMEEGAEWPASWFQNLWVDNFPPANELQLKVLSLDPSKGKTDKLGDYSAYVVLAYGKDQCIYIGADMDNRRSAERIVDDGLQLVLKHKPDAFALETNASQDLFGVLFQKEAARQGIHIRFHKEQQCDGPIWCEYHHSRSKVGRIREWGQYINPVANKVRFVRSMPQSQLLMDQFMMFPTGKSDPGVDDGPDSAAMALECAMEISHIPELIRSR